MSASLRAPHADLIRHFHNATRDPKSLAMVQGLKIERRIRCALSLGHAFTHFGPCALDDLGCPKPGLVGRLLNMVDR